MDEDEIDRLLESLGLSPANPPDDDRLLEQDWDETW